MKKEHSIALLTCWYGEYPWYFPYFIKSCIYNPTIDFIIVTDNKEVIPHKPYNVIIIQKSLEELKIEASKKLGFDLNFDNTYKFCDLKPAFGLFFKDVFEKYDFWGHGDIDMVYGDIRGFMTTELLTEYDIISAHHNFITGTFCLYRNNDLMRTLFTESRDYQRVFADSEYLGFDECDFLFYKLDSRITIFDFPDNIQSMTYVVCKAELDGRIKPLFEFYLFQTMTNKIRWDNGLVIFDDKIECLFYDMIHYKKDCQDQTASYPIPDVFYFNEKGINKNSYWKLLKLKLKNKKINFGT